MPPPPPRPRQMLQAAPPDRRADAWLGHPQDIELFEGLDAALDEVLQVGPPPAAVGGTVQPATAVEAATLGMLGVRWWSEEDLGDVPVPLPHPPSPPGAVIVPPAEHVPRTFSRPSSGEVAAAHAEVGRLAEELSDVDLDVVEQDEDNSEVGSDEDGFEDDLELELEGDEDLAADASD